MVAASAHRCALPAGAAAMARTVGTVWTPPARATHNTPETSKKGALATNPLDQFPPLGQP